MNILVTGARGFLGRHLIGPLIADAGNNVVALVRDQRAIRGWYHTENWDAVTDVIGNVCDLPFMERVLAEHEIYTVYHLASQVQVSVAEANPVGTFDSNIRGTWSVLEACRRQKVRRIIIASTDKAYGDGPVPYIETQPMAGRAPYEVSKSCADLIAQSYIETYGMSIAITRCGNLYGPGHMNFSTLIPGTIRSILEGKAPVLRSDGTMRRDYLYVEDAVDAYVKLAESCLTGAFNFGSGEASSSVLAIVKAILLLMKSDLRPDIRRTAKHEIQDQWLDITKARRDLGWEPKTSLEEGLKKTIAWYRSFLGENK